MVDLFPDLGLMMKAIYIKGFGPTLSLDLRDVKKPSIRDPADVLVRVHAAGLNRADLLQARGLYPPPAGYSPNIPGLEFAGEVVAIGDDVREWKVGDSVFGITAGEAQAEFVLTDASLLARIPDNLDFNQAAAVPEAFITAHDAIFTRGRLKPAESLLIHAVGSGVGLAALQLAKAHGATVIGTSRTADKLEKCRDFGLDIPIATADAIDFAEVVREKTAGKGVDVILDLVGAAYFTENLECLASQGRLVLVGLTSGAKTELDMRLVLQKRATIVGTVLRSRSKEEKADATRKFANDVLPLLESGKVVPNLDRAFTVEDVVDAYKYLESNESFGKVVLKF